MKKKYFILTSYFNKLQDLPLFFIRLFLAYTFFEPALKKLQNIEGTTTWFEKMGIPFPELNVYLSGTVEFAGFVLLIFGFGTRVISFPLIITMIVAIFTAHSGESFSGGWDMPILYIVLLFTLIVYGPGKISLDHLLKKN